MKVLKFGGSSVADATRISRVMDIVSAALVEDRTILVCSAISGCTDSLIRMGQFRTRTDDIHGDESTFKAEMQSLKERHYSIAKRLFTGEELARTREQLEGFFDALDLAGSDECQTFGELFSTTIISRKFACEGINTFWMDSRELVRTDEEGKLVSGRTYELIARAVESHPEVRLFVAPGFIASDPNGRPTTLGRGGSDYSAAIYAAAVQADELEIWTDVPGIMSANPRTVPTARTIPHMSYGAALSMAAGGAKVLYAPTVKPAMEAGIAISIKNTFDPANPGTLIDGTECDETLLGVTSAPVSDDPERSRLCIVGEKVTMRDSVSIQIRTALEHAGISPVSKVGGSGDTFFVDVRKIVENEAVAAVHREFFESRPISQIAVFIAGYGAVGRKLVELAERSRKRIAVRTGKSIHIAGVSDSRHFIIDMHGLTAEEIEARLEKGESAADGAYLRAIRAAAPVKAVFVDCTNDHELYRSYADLMRHGFNIVTSNRRSIAVPFVQYAAMKAAARENGAFFRYDTTVGTALPVLESIASSANCSDSIVSIEAVVSCTLNFIISSYDGEKRDSFAALFKRAQDIGLTERDPRTDLGGKDVLRKLLILAREAGVPLEESDVEIVPMLGPEFFACNLDEFYSRLAEYEPQFVAREAELDARVLRQRFVASLTKDPDARLGYKAEIRIREVGQDSPFYNISGTENVIVVRSEHSSSPLVIKGPGEGVEPAASGIIKDILS